MFKYLQVKRICLILLLTSLGSFAHLANSAIIANFDTQVDISISSTFSSNIFESTLFDNLLIELDDATGTSNGSGDSGLLPFTSKEPAKLTATSSGQVGAAGFVVSSWSTDGYFAIDNTLNSTSDNGDIQIDISWLSRIFTTSATDDEAFSSFSVYIKNIAGDVIYDDLFELDSLIEGPGLFEYRDSTTINISNLTVANAEIEEYYIQLDVFGMAANYSEVSAPSSVLISSVALFFLYRKSNLKVK